MTTGDALVKAIPTETLALYTFLLGLFIGNGKEDAVTGYLALRWWTYAGFVVLTLLAVWLTYWLSTRSTELHKRRKLKLPMLEAATATLAAGVWGLVMPGSALQTQLPATTA